MVRQSHHRRVVITGMGAVTALGEGIAPLWDAAAQGRSGIDILDVAAASGSWKFAAGVVPNFTPEKFVTQRKSLKVMARDIQLAVAGAMLAFQDSGLAQFDRERFGVIVGSGVLNHELDELGYSIQHSLDEKKRLDLKRFGTDGLSALFPLWLLKYLPNMSACHISVLLDLQGMNNTITTGSSAGLQAVGEAMRIIQRGGAEIMLAGGAESKVNAVGMSQYKVLGALSDPASTSKEDYRPFDASARGFIVGEGAGFLVLEEYEHAARRGAKILAELAGFGSSSSRGRRQSMEAALSDAGLKPSELPYLQASGIGLKDEDASELQAIHELFNGSGKNLSVSASKSVTGFTGFSSGPLDLIISIEALRRKTIPPVVNFSKAEKEWDFNIVKGSAQKKDVKYAMTNSSGFNGQAVSVVVKEAV
jgi:3-oxoacyl-[acyl-carrier-protein] synthase II